MTRISPDRYRRTRDARRSPIRTVLDCCLAAAILGLLALLVAHIDPIETHEAGGDVIVNDGDTITLGGERIRLRGIDAPEYAQTCRRDGTDYPCGRHAREALARLVAGRPVTCEGRGRDRYGRFLAVCTAAGVDLNRAQIDEGWAVAYGDYENAERTARERRAGIWAGTFEEPRDWRATHGRATESVHEVGGSILDWLREIFRFS